MDPGAPFEPPMASAEMDEAAENLEESEILDLVQKKPEVRGEAYQMKAEAGSDQPVSVQAFQF